MRREWYQIQTSSVPGPLSPFVVSLMPENMQLIVAIQPPAGDPLRTFFWLLNQSMFWSVLGLGMGPYLFYRGFALYRRKRFIEDIPRSPIRSAAIGAVEISGKAVGPYTLVAPLTKRDCLFYRVVIRFLAKKKPPFVDEVCAPLFVDDGTGELMIYPDGAEMQWTSEGGGGGEYLNHILARRGVDTQEPVEAREYCIVPGDDIFVLGTLQENPWAKRDPEATSLSRIGPGFVSLGEADLLRREAFVSLDPTLPSGAAGNRDFNLYPPTILMKGKGPFVISTHSQREVLSQLGWKSLLYIVAGPLWALWGLWAILSHL
jgi:hypothetical protein